MASRRFVEAKLDTENLKILARESPKMFYDAMRASFVIVFARMQATHAEKRLSGRPGLARRTGALARSFQTSITGDKVDDLRGVYFSTSRYAAIHESGGTITGKGKLLAIPLAAARTSAGVSRYPSPLRQTLPASFPNGTFVRRSRAGNLILFGKNPDRSITPLFALKQSVTIPPRLGAKETWEKEVVPTIPKTVVTEIEKRFGEVERKFKRGRGA